jgi:dsDNA-specific endonuclease/ATPase MutS2
MTPPSDDFDEPRTEPIQTDQLDLHTFQPSECADVVEEFVRAAQAEGYRIVRIIHGKGTGNVAPDRALGPRETSGGGKVYSRRRDQR